MHCWEKGQKTDSNYIWLFIKAKPKNVNKKPNFFVTIFTEAIPMQNTACNSFARITKNNMNEWCFKCFKLEVRNIRI